jgi:hypothetical protein
MFCWLLVCILNFELDVSTDLILFIHIKRFHLKLCYPSYRVDGQRFNVGFKTKFESNTI